MTENLQPFQRLQTQLAVLIAQTAPGDRLLNEPELARQMGVSRATLREAMRAFEGQGLIRRRQGVGTFVVGRSQVIESGLEVLESIETQAKRIGLQVTMGELRIEPAQASVEQASALQVEEGTPLVHVSRVISAENRPVAYLVDILPENILNPEVLRSGFTGSVLDLLLSRGAPLLSHSLAEIQATAAPSDIARALQIQRGDVLLMFIANLFDMSGKVVDLSSSYFLPGYFRFHVVRRVGN